MMHTLLRRPASRLCWTLLVGVVAGCASTPERPVVVKAPTPHIAPKHLAGLSLQLIARMESEKKWYAALSWLDRYRQQYPASDTSNLLRARALAATGSSVEAEKYFNRLLSSPLAADGYQGLGLLAAAQGQQDRAIRYFTRASRHNPTNPGILNDLGYAYLQNHEPEQARSALFRAGELAPDDSRIWSNIALYYLLRNQTLQAQEVISSHQLDWDTQQMIHAEAARMMGLNHPQQGLHAPGQTDAATQSAQFPNQPLTQLFTANPAQSTNPSRTAP